MQCICQLSHGYLTIILKGEGQPDQGIYIKSVVDGGAAAMVSV